MRVRESGAHMLALLQLVVELLSLLGRVPALLDLGRQLVFLGPERFLHEPTRC